VIGVVRARAGLPPADVPAEVPLGVPAEAPVEALEEMSVEAPEEMLLAVPAEVSEEHAGHEAELSYG
jgi:hypothetical protein